MPRRGQFSGAVDNFQRIWNTAFRASDLAAAVADDADTEPTDGTDTEQ
jgi:hypothetical protein